MNHIIASSLSRKLLVSPDLTVEVAFKAYLGLIAIVRFIQPWLLVTRSRFSMAFTGFEPGVAKFAVRCFTICAITLSYSGSIGVPGALVWNNCSRATKGDKRVRFLSYLFKWLFPSLSVNRFLLISYQCTFFTSLNLFQHFFFKTQKGNDDSPSDNSQSLFRANFCSTYASTQQMAWNVRIRGSKSCFSF